VELPGPEAVHVHVDEQVGVVQRVPPFGGFVEPEGLVGLVGQEVGPRFGFDGGVGAEDEVPAVLGEDGRSLGVPVGAGAEGFFWGGDPFVHPLVEPPGPGGDELSGDDELGPEPEVDAFRHASEGVPEGVPPQFPVGELCAAACEQVDVYEPVEVGEGEVAVPLDGFEDGQPLVGRGLVAVYEGHPLGEPLVLPYDEPQVGGRLHAGVGDLVEAGEAVPGVVGPLLGDDVDGEWCPPEPVEVLGEAGCYYFHPLVELGGVGFHTQSQPTVAGSGFELKLGQHPSDMQGFLLSRGLTVLRQW